MKPEAKTPDPAAVLEAVRLLLGEDLKDLTPARALDNLEALVKKAQGDARTMLLLQASAAVLRQMTQAPNPEP